MIKLSLWFKSWKPGFFADPEMLGNHFGPKFLAGKLPSWPALESVPKQSIYDALKKATANCEKRGYSKGKVSFELLANLNPDRVEEACPHAKTLLDRLRHR